MIRLKRGSKNKSASIGLGQSVRLLIAGILLLSVNGCALFSKNVKSEPILTDPVIVQQTNSTVQIVKGGFVDSKEYWCVEKKTFTAILQEADRCD